MKKTIYSKEHKRMIAKLILARQESQLSQKDVARLINSTQSHVSKIETGQKRIDVVEIMHLARVYKKEVQFFLE